MRCGTPLVISDTPALLEVAGDAALVAPGTSSPGIADQIKRVILDHSLAAEYRKRGIERAAQFSWAKTASETVALLQRVIQKH